MEKIYGQFTSIVAEGRGLDKEYVDSIAQGRVWAGDDALDLRLADRKGSIMDALRYAVLSSEEGKETPDLQDWDIVEYPKPLTTVEMLMKNLNGTSASVFKGTPLENVEEAFKGWDGNRSGKVYARMPYELSIAF